MEDWEGGTLEESGKLEDPRYRCEHGTFIGDPYGPDYLCYWCEMGISKEEYEEIQMIEALYCKRKDKFMQKYYNLRYIEDEGERIRRAERLLILLVRRYRR